MFRGRTVSCSFPVGRGCPDRSSVLHEIRHWRKMSGVHLIVSLTAVRSGVAHTSTLILPVAADQEIQGH